MHRALFVLSIWLLSGAGAWAQEQRARVYKLEELTWPQIDALDRTRTLVILPVGMIEQHGPHLPVGADTIGVTYEADRAAKRVSQALPEWNVVMMPAINYGQGGANLLGDMLVHPGTYGIRVSTLRSIVADLGGQLARNRFKWIFVVSGHGAPSHGVAINEACDFVSESFGVTMLALMNLFRADDAVQEKAKKMHAAHFSAAELSSFGLDVHAGVSETSGMLAIRPDLVRPDYRTLPDRSGRSFEDLRKVALAPGWQGYVSSPAKATAAYGRAVEEWWIEGLADLLLRAVRGENMAAHARVPETVPPDRASLVEKALADEAAFEAKLESWLAQRRQRK